MQADDPVDPQHLVFRSLADLPVGRSAVVARMDETHHVMMIRLKTMGMHEGRAIRMLRQGSRLMVQCAGTRIGVSKEIARHVLVQMLG